MFTLDGLLHIRSGFSQQPKGFQKRVGTMFNFIKHGRMELTKKVKFMPVVAESMLTDCCESYKHLNGKMTPQMKLFLARWAIENPSVGNVAITPHLVAAAKAHDLAGRNRSEFLQEGFKRLLTCNI